MADNTQLSTNIGSGDIAATASLTISGDTAVVQMIGNGILSGGEGTWVYSQFVGGAGAVAAGVQRVTLASDDPAVALLGTIDADTSTLAAAVTGGQYQVDVVASLPAGTNAIGKLSANTGVDIGDVDILSIAAGDNNIGNVDIVSLPAGNLGQRAMAASLSVVPASDITDTTYIGDIKFGESLPAGTNNIGDVDIVKVGSVVDANNSTTTPLGGDAVYTGTGTDLLGYTAVTCTLYANVDSATDGMTFEFSIDNSNWDDIYTFTMDVSSSDTRRFQFPVCARYFRIVYTNGSGAQSAVRIQTILHTGNQLTSIHRLSNDMSPDRSAQVVKSVLFAQKAGSGDFTGINSTAGGNLKVAIEEFDASLPAGDNNIGNVDIVTVPAPLSTTGAGTEAAAQRVTIANDSTGLLSVDDNSASLTVDTTGTSGLEVVQVTAGDLNMTEASASAIKTAVELIDDTIIAHDAPAGSAKAIIAGGEARSTESTAVASADAARLITDLVGKLITKPYAIPELTVNGTTAALTDTTSTSVIAAPGAGVRLYITDVMVTNSHATTGTQVTLEDEDGNDLWTGYAREDGGGFCKSFKVPLRVVANKAFHAKCITTGSSVFVSAQGYTGV